MRKNSNISYVVKNGLCTGCGTCVAICPQNAIDMCETSNGLLFAQVDNEICDYCGLCLQVCGGHHLFSDLLSENTDPFKGDFLAAYYGFSTDPDIRLRGQSGGIATALLTFLFETKRIDQALVSQMPSDGSLRPKPLLADRSEDLWLSQGSKYCPVALNAAIPRNIGKNDQRLAIVGLPCQLHSLRNAQQIHRHWREGIALTIGLFCDRTLAYGVIDYLITRSNSSTKKVKAFRYRDKTLGGWPGSIFIQKKNGKKMWLPSKERHAIKDYFTPPRCRLCFDKMNIFSDISVGDAWGVKEDGKGFSVVIARTEKGLHTIQDAQRSGYLSLTQIDPEEIFLGQKIEKRRRQWTAFTKFRNESREVLPEFHIPSNYYSTDADNIYSYVKRQYSWEKNYFSRKNTKNIIHVIKKKAFIQKLKKS